MPVLKQATRCHFCGQAMQAGAEFEWHEKPARWLRKGVMRPARWVPAHVGFSCVVDAEKAERAEREAALQAGADKLEAMWLAEDWEGVRAHLNLPADFVFTPLKKG